MSMNLLNIDLEILELFIKDWEKLEYGREIAKKLQKNQKTISNRLKNLEKQGILRSKLNGKTKNYQLNTENKTTINTILITEIHKKIKFLEKQPIIQHIIKDTNQIVGVFGSYTKNTSNESSDIDIFVIGNNEQNYDEEGKTYDLPISTKQFKKGEFKELLKRKQPLAAEIAHHHILIHNIEDFTKIVARKYYGKYEMV